MITNDQILDLPKDTRLAFVEYVRLLRHELATLQNNQDYQAERVFISHMRAFLDTHDVGLSLDRPPPDDTFFENYFKHASDEIDYAAARLSLEALRVQPSSLDFGIRLAEDYRTQIHRHLETVRKIVVAVDIEERLRESILSRLNDLSAEVDKSRSGLTKFADALIEISAAVGEGAEKLEPAVKLMERIAGVLGKARKENDVERITGEDRKLISGPSQADEDVADRGGCQNEDEIPF